LKVILMAKKKKLWYEFTSGFIGGTVKKPVKGLTKSMDVAKRQKVKGTRLRKIVFPSLWAMWKSKK